MRNLALLLLSSLAVAQDDGVSLFYKGFWLEQAEGKLDEAAALYGKLLAEKPDAPEAPRALLGLVRIKAARNEDARELVAELERRYPAAKEEIEAARRFAVREEFDPERKPGDSLVVEKMKSLASQAWTEADRFFLVDLGSAAHPMLAQGLRASNDVYVRRAAGVLVEQRTPEAFAVLATALLDKNALFRSTIVRYLRDRPPVPATVVDALATLFDRSAPRLRGEIVETVAALLSGPGKERAFSILTKALDDDDETVRSPAFLGVASPDAPDAYVGAVLRRIESGEACGSYVVPQLLRFADRAAFRDRIEKILDVTHLQRDALPSSLPDEAGTMLARSIVRNRDKRPPSSDLVAAASRASPRAAAILLLAALETDDRSLLKGVTSIGSGTVSSRIAYLGAEADRLRTAAIASEKSWEVGHEILKLVGVSERDFESIVEGLRQRGESGLSYLLLSPERLGQLGPEKAGALVEFCRDPQQAAALLEAGAGFAHREDRGLAFFARVIPKAGPSAAGALRQLASYPALAPCVAERLLAAGEPEWKWGCGATSAQEAPGPWAWWGIPEERKVEPPVRAALLAYVVDPRSEIRGTAVWVAAKEKGDAGTEALRRAFASNFADVRGAALEALVARGADGPALVRELARRADLTDTDRAAVGAVLSQGPAYGPVASELLRLGTWPNLWWTYLEIAPKECVALALTEAVGDKGGDHRWGAIEVLASVSDPRRIDVFRKVLGGADGRAIRLVLEAVRDQYMVELGEEALAQLRNPDSDVRQTATEAIEKLKFYAEARKAFEK